MDVFFFCRAAGCCKDPPVEEAQPTWWLQTKAEPGEDCPASAQDARQDRASTTIGREGLAADGLPLALHARLRHIQSVQQFHLWRLRGLEAHVRMLRAEKMRLERGEGCASSGAPSGQAPSASAPAPAEQKIPVGAASRSLSTVAETESREETPTAQTQAVGAAVASEVRAERTTAKKYAGGKSPQLEFPTYERSVSVSTTLPSTPATNASSCTGTPASFTSRSISREVEGRCLPRSGPAGSGKPETALGAARAEESAAQNAGETKDGASEGFDRRFPGASEQAGSVPQTRPTEANGTDSKVGAEPDAAAAVAPPASEADERRVTTLHAAAGEEARAGSETERKDERERKNERERKDGRESVGPRESSVRAEQKCMGGGAAGRREVTDLTTQVTDAGEFYQEANDAERI
ncbi:conserved hypothetical protein [Neospora caninum Liverpool]|uniref:Uncharacterized protein n=1 Tax=Neospora caninum (strain Liverpool) TaxID=572307 RepID=F0VN69_NEOCL|nr:conserved hypothetical protein [Neospora caninum Liverpool]CBZ55165.1 conserved hypothetical protein [Neospora caninum Liverpool]CEL69892.1 TPA: hypothetical protein BN1204_055900 [Neospora caninum Liverpool]|eukprot:XP_003885193.1 conserved hypothetical protein [Neospora caninum Liverpool]